MSAAAGASGTGTNTKTSSDNSNSNDNHEQQQQPIGSLISSTPAPQLIPLQPFVAWCGVLTLVYSGWPTSIVSLKKSIQSRFGGTLQPENSGSMFPKSTLGCLRDGVTLSQQQLNGLLELCSATKQRWAQHQHQHQQQQQQQQMNVSLQCASVILLSNRSLSQYIHRSDIPFLTASAAAASAAAPSTTIAAASDDTKSTATKFTPSPVVVEIDSGSSQRVTAVLSESGHANYLDCVNKPGNRATHYTAPITNQKTESTLVSFLSSGSGSASAASGGGAGLPERLSQALSEFRSSVDKLLPGCYVWFPDSSLHVTIRSLA